MSDAVIAGVIIGVIVTIVVIVLLTTNGEDDSGSVNSRKLIDSDRDDIHKSVRRNLRKDQILFDTYEPRDQVSTLRVENGVFRVYDYGGLNPSRTKATCAFLNSLKLSKVSGYVRINSEDGIDDVYDRDGVLTPSGRWMMPDPYQMDGYGGRIDTAQSNRAKWAEKKDIVCFAGASTGFTSPSKWVDWSLENPDVSNIRFTSVVQDETVRDEQLGDRMSIDEQLGYKFVLSIQGNGAAWDRPAWVLASNSILLMDVDTPDLWYYEDMRRFGAFVAVTPGTIRSVMQSFVNDPFVAAEMIQRQKEFFHKYMRVECAREYMRYAFSDDRIAYVPSPDEY